MRRLITRAMSEYVTESEAKFIISKAILYLPKIVYSNCQ